MNFAFDSGKCRKCQAASLRNTVLQDTTVHEVLDFIRGIDPAKRGEAER